MLTKLLAPKGQRTAAAPLIQVIGNTIGALSGENKLYTYELCHEKTNILHMRKQRRRSGSR